jgi:glycosyltransferase involved in cell wall biosynthesis
LTSGGSWRGLEVLVVSPTPTHPQDHGNRKRIFEVCKALQRRGAKVHFLHYPGEHDWRHDRPARREAAMMKEWDSYQLVAPTRPLHSSAAQVDHAIDEWADPSVSQYLAWACAKRRYDLAIVNYTWMSFALESISASTYTVLDTHDMFGNRRALLEANDIAPEFFHTTRDDEARGLKRADLVWAIKDPEREYFTRDLGVANVLTMLHAEPQRGGWSAPPSKDGWLRAGVIGARNNINRRNLENFLDVSLPIFAKYMAPVKIIIGGGCSDDFAGWSHPNVEIVGRVEQVEDFYQMVDVIIVPIRFSTGLKIKASEALASGAPVVAHAHAMEGYPTVEPLHLLPSFEAMAVELAKLSFDRAPLERLAASSRTTCAKIQASVDAAIEATRLRVLEKLGGRICVIAPMEALDPKSLLHDHFRTAIDYIRFAADIEIFLTGPAEKPRLDSLRGYDLQHRVFVDADAWESADDLLPDTWTKIDLADLLAVRGYTRAYVMADCYNSLLFGVGALREAFVRSDMIEIAGGDADALINRLRKCMDVVVIGGAPRRVQHWEGVRGVAKVVHAPVMRNERFGRLDAGRDKAGPDLFILASQDDLLALELAKLCQRLGAEARLLDLADAGTANAIRRTPQHSDPLEGLARAKALVDLTPSTALSATVGEAAMRGGVPVLTLVRGPGAAAFWRFKNHLRHASVSKLLSTVTSALADSATHAALCELNSLQISARAKADAGWSVLWGLLTKREEPNGEFSSAAAMALFGRKRSL